MFKRLFIAIVLLGLVVGGIVWFKFFRDEMIARYLGSMVPPPVPVTTEQIEPITWEPGIDAVGTALSVRGVDLAIESGGLVEAVLFTANDRVEAGQHLLQIQDRSERASLAAAQAAAQVADAEAERARTLSDRGVGAANVVETADAQAASAHAQVAQVEIALENKSLAAPFSGVIGIPRVEEGQWVTPGMIYATLQDLGAMRVDFSLPEQEIGHLKLGGAVSVSSEVGDFSADGRIIGIEPRVDPNSRLVSVRAEVENPSGQLYPGQFLHVRIVLPAEDGVIAVPQTAVDSSLYGDTIYVVRGEGDDLVAEQLFVKLGRRWDGRIEVTEGLKGDERIVTSGQNRLSPGARVSLDDSVSLDVVNGQQGR